ncbi:MAG: hypothetical protein ACRDRN_19960 [Sciscionella sp.]
MARPVARSGAWLEASAAWFGRISAVSGCGEFDGWPVAAGAGDGAAEVTGIGVGDSAGVVDDVLHLRTTVW